MSEFDERCDYIAKSLWHLNDTEVVALPRGVKIYLTLSLLQIYHHKSFIELKIDTFEVTEIERKKANSIVKKAWPSLLGIATNTVLSQHEATLELFFNQELEDLKSGNYVNPENKVNKCLVVGICIYKTNTAHIRKLLERNSISKLQSEFLEEMRALNKNVMESMEYVENLLKEYRMVFMLDNNKKNQEINKAYFRFRDFYIESHTHLLERSLPIIKGKLRSWYYEAKDINAYFRQFLMTLGQNYAADRKLDDCVMELESFVASIESQLEPFNLLSNVILLKQKCKKMDTESICLRELELVVIEHEENFEKSLNTMEILKECNILFERIRKTNKEIAKHLSIEKGDFYSADENRSTASTLLNLRNDVVERLKNVESDIALLEQKWTSIKQTLDFSLEVNKIKTAFVTLKCESHDFFITAFNRTCNFKLNFAEINLEDNLDALIEERDVVVNITSGYNNFITDALSAKILKLELKDLDNIFVQEAKTLQSMIEAFVAPSIFRDIKKVIKQMQEEFEKNTASSNTITLDSVVAHLSKAKDIVASRKNLNIKRFSLTGSKLQDMYKFLARMSLFSANQDRSEKPNQKLKALCDRAIEVKAESEIIVSQYVSLLDDTLASKVEKKLLKFNKTIHDVLTIDDIKLSHYLFKIQTTKSQLFSLKEALENIYSFGKTYNKNGDLSFFPNLLQRVTELSELVNNEVTLLHPKYDELDSIETEETFIFRNYFEKAEKIDKNFIDEQTSLFSFKRKLFKLSIILCNYFSFLQKIDCELRKTDSIYNNALTQKLKKRFTRLFNSYLRILSRFYKIAKNHNLRQKSQMLTNFLEFLRSQSDVQTSALAKEIKIIKIQTECKLSQYEAARFIINKFKDIRDQRKAQCQENVLFLDLLFECENVDNPIQKTLINKVLTCDLLPKNIFTRLLSDSSLLTSTTALEEVSAYFLETSVKLKKLFKIIYKNSKTQEHINTNRKQIYSTSSLIFFIFRHVNWLKKKYTCENSSVLHVDDKKTPFIASEIIHMELESVCKMASFSKNNLDLTKMGLTESYLQKEKSKTPTCHEESFLLKSYLNEVHRCSNIVLNIIPTLESFRELYNRLTELNVEFRLYYNLWYSIKFERPDPCDRKVGKLYMGLRRARRIMIFSIKYALFMIEKEENLNALLNDIEKLKSFSYRIYLKTHKREASTSSHPEPEHYQLLFDRFGSFLKEFYYLFDAKNICCFMTFLTRQVGLFLELYNMDNPYLIEIAQGCVQLSTHNKTLAIVRKRYSWHNLKSSTIGIRASNLKLELEKLIRRCSFRTSELPTRATEDQKVVEWVTEIHDELSEENEIQLHEITNTYLLICWFETAQENLNQQNTTTKHHLKRIYNLLISFIAHLDDQAAVSNATKEIERSIIHIEKTSKSFRLFSFDTLEYISANIAIFKPHTKRLLAEYKRTFKKFSSFSNEFISLQNLLSTFEAVFTFKTSVESYTTLHRFLAFCKPHKNFTLGVLKEFPVIVGQCNRKTKQMRPKLRQICYDKMDLYFQDITLLSLNWINECSLTSILKASVKIQRNLSSCSRKVEALVKLARELKHHTSMVEEARFQLRTIIVPELKKCRLAYEVAFYSYLHLKNYPTYKGNTTTANQSAKDLFFLIHSALNKTNLELEALEIEVELPESIENSTSETQSKLSLLRRTVSLNAFRVNEVPDVVSEFILTHAVKYPWIRRTGTDGPAYFYVNDETEEHSMVNSAFENMLDKLDLALGSDTERTTLEVFVSIRYYLKVDKIEVLILDEIFNTQSLMDERDIESSLSVLDVAKYLFVAHSRSIESKREEGCMEQFVWVDVVINLLESVFYDEPRQKIHLFSFVLSLVLLSTGTKKRKLDYIFRLVKFSPLSVSETFSAIIDIVFKWTVFFYKIMKFSFPNDYATLRQKFWKHYESCQKTTEKNLKLSSIFKHFFTWLETSPLDVNWFKIAFRD